MLRLTLVVGLLSLSAYAQEAKLTAPLPPPSDVSKAVLQPPTMANSRWAADAPVVEEASRLDPGGRVRWGIGGGIGWHSPYGAFGLNLEGRVGSQLGAMLSAYLAIGAHIGVGIGGGLVGAGAQANGTIIGHFTMAALAEVLFANHLFAAAGPAFGLGAMGVGGLGIATTGGTITGVSATGFKPGFDIRAGWGFHSPNKLNFKRKGFNLGIDVLTLFHLNGVVAEVSTDFSGAQATVQKAATLVTVTPMITLSYESR